MYPQCHAGIAVPNGLYAFLAAEPDGQYQLPRQLSCELQSGHGTDHAGFLQSIGPDEHAAWWLLWDDTAGMRSLIQLPYCCDDCTAADACLLPAGHEGRHGPQLATTLDVPPGVRLLLPARDLVR
ncbi:hypothetical protein QEZ54_29740 [Catellatospora sp. KI3]|uniref:hypothetical protein n=1 Tax=Catellatospora sp. KI3 TaxID=3041620 RepID=UPI0024828D5B|nr:hypothetical protein [Catellatospora sp. KI3]MDI1465159.1 hypothetical protein [Catellatospora sp. KI3]